MFDATVRDGIQVAEDDANFVAPHGSAGGVIRAPCELHQSPRQPTIRLVEPANKVQNVLLPDRIPSQRKGFTLSSPCWSVEDRHGTVWTGQGNFGKDL
jgi:hypothetical protein